MKAKISMAMIFILWVSIFSLGAQEIIGEEIELVEPRGGEFVETESPQDLVALDALAPSELALAESEVVAVSDSNSEVLVQVLPVLWNLDLDSGVGGVELDFNSLATLVQAVASDSSQTVVSDQEVPPGVLNNEYYRESLRYKKLAQEAFEYGDYDAAAQYAAESLKFAQQSNEYIALQLKIREVNTTLLQAKTRLDWAASIGADKTYPIQVSRARQSYDQALQAKEAEQWDEALRLAREAVQVLAEVQELAPLPAKYTVRPWATSRDCLWNIAGYSWVYGDPTKWKILYEANKKKFPQPDNPNLIHPGMVLDIPSIRGEYRTGVWVSGRAYVPLPKPVK
ncbi:MAG TPA: hypothetical protein PLW34_12090 [Termitinemataceae bacterium]|uniref:hypothetical protein n=1 Tax=Treponema sp. J25 TaxID=2094121 RepID=UPI001FB80A45|nr:hypothetical protein [Treponema sp. J25]HOK00288.1 hypothetical protein [Termitinemataceae bacterium]HOM24518.1 hypothetical protein [Termitinemataceae bacterium]HPQ01604.1 hypothetical protein [Termitinemataceae bacterium]